MPCTIGRYMLRNLVLAAVLAAPFSSPGAARADDAAALAQALGKADARDWSGALTAARASGPLAFDIIEWERLRAGEGSFAAYADFAGRRAEWPGMPLLRKKAEGAMAEVPGPEIIRWFGKDAPQTGTGALALAGALTAAGQTTEAEKVVVAAWRGLDLTAAEEAQFLALYPEQLKPQHGGRIAALLDRGSLAQARRMLPLVTPGTFAVAQARIALQAGDKGVDALLKAVPESMAGSSGLARDRAAWRNAHGAEDGAADLMLERSVSAEALGTPALWAKARANLARRDLRAGEYRRAYRLAANHHLTSGGDFADLEWLAGYAALKLGDAPTAERHFTRLRAGVNSPISLSRAGYWQGRAYEAMGKAAEAREAYGFAATYQTAFYGLLAAERAGLPMDPALVGGPLPDWQNADFAAAPVFQAAVLLRAAGDIDLAERFMLHLSETLSASQIAQMAKLALDWQDAHLALMLAKAAAERGEMLTAAYYPLPGFDASGMGMPPEWVLAIARRESEFDPKVVSGAGAQGLMQVMPGTAKMMADKLGLPYEGARLTRDPDYNAKLGAAYLAGLRQEFGNSPALVAAGYNAGPGRPRRWITEQGDPRDPGVDVVDWIEMIPFTETRNYVMRVSEALPIYRARLAGKPVPIALIEELKGR
jgi:soluble lytic murein transglycosylase